MAWTSPITWVANTILTAAQLNQQLRDNMLQTAPAVATAGGRIIVTTALNAIAEREILNDIVETSQTTSSTSYDDVATVGPTVTLTTGALAMVWINAEVGNDTDNSVSWASFEVSGDTTSAAIDGRAIIYRTAGANYTTRAGVSTRVALTPGSNTFTMKYRVTSGTGTFARRRLEVMAL